MSPLTPAAILLLNLSPADIQFESGVTLEPLAQSFYPERDDDLPELFLPREGDSDPDNFERIQLDPLPTGVPDRALV